MFKDGWMEVLKRSPSCLSVYKRAKFKEDKDHVLSGFLSASTLQEFRKSDAVWKLALKLWVFIWDRNFSSAYSDDLLQLIHLSPLSSPTFSSTIVHLLQSPAWLSYADLLYLSKDTDAAAAALVLEEIMELESTWAMSERSKWSKAEKRSNLSTKWFGAAIQSMRNSVAVSYFSSAPGPRG